MKLVSAETERDALRDERARLQKELAFSKDQIHRKNDEYQSTLDDLTNAHRKAEDEKLSAIQDLDQKKYELQDLQVKLTNYIFKILEIWGIIKIRLFAIFF